MLYISDKSIIKSKEERIFQEFDLALCCQRAISHWLLKTSCQEFNKNKNCIFLNYLLCNIIIFCFLCNAYMKISQTRTKFIASVVTMCEMVDTYTHI